MPPSTRRSQRSTRRSSPSESMDENEIRNSSLESNASDGENPRRKTRVTFSQDDTNPPSPSVSDGSSARRVSARAARSARRQAKIDVDPPAKKGGNSSKNAFKRRMEIKRSASNTSNSKKDKDEELFKRSLHVYHNLLLNISERE
ncbi:predicted protein [Chaetoceros tenuissimus]|uniref:Uncharacterized protein n=1 Tax=Chaetoceros tenuissimus TaxID=426638 RepID=A0AAD3CMP0_9STRA|nr:predicted protein [Chaetoceros tenuissimus]